MSLLKLYYNYNDPVSLGSIAKLKRKTPKSTLTIKQWLASQEAVRKAFPRKQYYVSRPN